MPHDIGPDLRLASLATRPHTHHGYNRAIPRIKEPANVRSVSASGSCSRRTDQSNVNKDDEHHIELLEYEWPDLPPIVNMKDAVCRKRVSQGINYLLPVDKSRNSIDSKFRTDLRAMFQEPYATEGSNYDDSRITKSAKVHFNTNVVDTRWTKKHIVDIPVNLNSDSENVRKLYAYSAPAGGRSRSGMNVQKLKTRSSLFLPIKARAHPEAQKLRREVDAIIKSVQEDNDEYNDDDEACSPESADKRKSIIGFRACDVEVVDEVQENIQPKFTADEFDSYAKLKNTKPPKNMIPEQFSSEFLSKEMNQGIWDWLHFGESITDFEYFMSVCG